MKNPVDRAGQPLTTSKPKAWMSRSKTKNGYIIRLSLGNGYKAYRAEHIANYNLLPSASKRANNRQIELWEDYYSYFGDHPQAPYRPAAAGSPRRPSCLAEATDDPVLDGRDLAEWDGVGRLLEGNVNAGRNVKVSADAEEKELADLRRAGLLYDDDREQNVELGLGDVVRERPVYTVRHVAGKGAKEKGVPDRHGAELAVDVEEGEEGEEAAQEVDEETGMLFVPESEFESWAEFAETNGFEVVMVDDLVSNAESWVEVDE